MLHFYKKEPIHISLNSQDNAKNILNIILFNILSCFAALYKINHVHPNRLLKESRKN